MTTAAAVKASATKPAKAEFLPYYETYISLVPDGDVVATLANQIGETLALLRGLPASSSTYRYAPEKWSVNELVGHMIDSERIFAPVIRGIADTNA
ncbi:MAG: DinB family protein, partial [Gemmatimonadales bacterium]